MLVPAPVPPIITFTTDFGLQDHYVATMKAAALRHCPHACLIDVTHQVPRHDIPCGSIMLERAVDGFPAGTVHLCVVDPGVGTDRKLLVVRTSGQLVVCPDNGLITWTWRLHGGKAQQIVWHPTAASAVFHGRDILAPVAGMLASRKSLGELVRPLKRPVLLDVAPVERLARKGIVIHIDAFGNATTNIPVSSIQPQRLKAVRVGKTSVGKLKRTYSDVPPGRSLAVIGSSGLLEIAVRDGSARDQLMIKVGDEVVLER